MLNLLWENTTAFPTICSWTKADIRQTSRSNLLLRRRDEARKQESSNLIPKLHTDKKPNQTRILYKCKLRIISLTKMWSKRTKKSGNQIRMFWIFWIAQNEISRDCSKFKHHEMTFFSSEFCWRTHARWIWKISQVPQDALLVNMPPFYGSEMADKTGFCSKYPTRTVEK